MCYGEYTWVRALRCLEMVNKQIFRSLDEKKIQKQKEKWDKCSAAELIARAKKLTSSDRTEKKNQKQKPQDITSSQEITAIESARKFGTATKRLESFADSYNFQIVYQNNPPDRPGLFLCRSKSLNNIIRFP